MVVDLLEWVLVEKRGPMVDRSRVALLWPGGSCTYEELNRRVDARARALAREGLQARAIRPVVASNDVSGIITLLATWRCGATLVPLNPKLTRGESDAARSALEGVAADAQVILWTDRKSTRLNSSH